MSSVSAKRVAALVVSKFGVDRVRVRQEVETLRSARGTSADLLAALVLKGLLTQTQAGEARDLLRARRPARANDTPAPRAALPPLDPRTVAGCRVLRRLGEGGMSAVYLAYHEGLRRHVAIKVLAADLAGNPVGLECFYREAKSGALLDHSNLVRGIASGRDEATGAHYLIREFVDGPSGHALLDRLGTLSVGDVARIALDIAQALEHLHGRHLVHRDVKPDNILLASDGTAKLADLGLVQRMGGARPRGVIVHGFGTSHYMPWEQAENPNAVDGRADIYALGATLYHMVTGQVPFPGDDHAAIVRRKENGDFLPASRVRSEVPAALDAILSRMLARRPEERYPTASHLIDDLRRSDLAASVPSFVGLDWNLDGRASRSTSEPTAIDCRPPSGARAVWYLRYRDPSGRWRKSKATTRQLMRRLRTGQLPADTAACSQPRGAYQPLVAYALFRRFVGQGPETPRPASPGPPTLPAPPVVSIPPTLFYRIGWQGFARLGLAIGLLSALAYAVCRAW